MSVMNTCAIVLPGSCTWSLAWVAAVLLSQLYQNMKYALDLLMMIPIISLNLTRSLSVMIEMANANAYEDSEAIWANVSSLTAAASLDGSPSPINLGSASLSPSDFPEVPFGTFCTICLDDILEDGAVQLWCHHVYHKDCIDAWLKHQSGCPLRCARPSAPMHSHGPESVAAWPLRSR